MRGSPRSTREHLQDFSRWPWRDFGCVDMTRRRAEIEAAFAQALAEQFRLWGIGDPWHVSPWVPFAKCGAA